MKRPFTLALALAAVLSAAEFPEAAISNGLIDARLYLPDAVRGYYRATRFDWSGIVASLRYRGREYFGVWFPRYDPQLHDSITGPVEEFGADDGGLGYASAKPGGSFLRIGVGVLRKPGEPGYRRFGTYEIADPGKWSVRKGPDSVEFTHEAAASGYGYLYRKTVRLTANEPEMVLEHSLRNAGRIAIHTTQYNHNFFVIGNQPAGPGYSVTFAFDARPVRGIRGPAAIDGRRLTFTRELQPGESVFTELTGFGATAKDYDVQIDNRDAGAGVRISGDRPLAKMVFWSNPRTVCPEPYIAIDVEPGGEMVWTCRYRFSVRP